ILARGGRPGQPGARSERWLTGQNWRSGAVGCYHTGTMVARSIGSGTVSFGLVSIPVKLYSTNEARAGVGFNLLHGKCGTRLKQQYICPKDEEIVERDAMVKGYEFAKGQYVTFSTEEIKQLEETASEAIEITEF